MSGVLARASIFLDGDPSGALDALAAVESAMRSAGQRLESIGRELSTKLSLPIVGIGTAAGQAAADFDTSMRKIAALTENPMSQVNLWRDDVRQLAIQYGKTGNEAADALFFITSAGINGSRAMEALTASLKGSAIGLGETKVVADAATSAMTAYAKTGLTAARATEILAAGVKFGKMEASQLAPQIGDVTGTAAALNVAFEDVVSTLAIFSRTGTSTAEGATQLNSIFSTLLGRSKESEKVLNAHGLSLKALRDTIKQPGGLIEVMRTLDRAFGDNLDQLREVIPNIRAFRGVMNALAQNGKEVDNVVQGVIHSQGMLEKSFADMQGPGFQLQQMWAKIKDALIEVGNVLLPIVLPAITTISDAVRGAAKWFASLSPEVKTFSVIALGAAAGLGPLLIGLGSLMSLLGAISFSSLVGGVTAVTGAIVGIGPALSNFAFISGIGPAFAAASLAGTGFRGVVAGMVPVMKNLFTAFAPFLATGIVVAGLGAIAYKYVEMRMEIARTTREMEEQQKRIDDLVRKTGPDQVAARLANVNATIARLTKKMNEDFAAARDAVTKTTFAADATSSAGFMLEQLKAGAISRKDYDKWVEKNNQSEQHSAQYFMDSALAAQDVIQQLNRQKGILVELDAAYKSATPNVQTHTAAVAQQPIWFAAATSALETLNKKLAENAVMEKLLGKDFDQTAEDAKAYSKAVTDMVNAGVPLDAKLGSTGVTLGELAAKFGILTKEVTDAKEAQQKLNDLYSQAKSAIEAAQTPLEKYHHTLDALKAALIDGKITLAEYNRGVMGALKGLQDAEDKTNDLKKAMMDLVKEGVNNFVDAVFDAKTNWGTFFTDMLRDIAKLIIKMAILNALFPKGSGTGGVLGKLLGFADGGFLSPGNVGLVGERGPELVSGGRSGLTVTPMPAMAAAAPGGHGDTMRLTFNINAIDSRDTARFFEENESLVAGAMFRAAQKSRLLSRTFGNR
jgi:TP901 family phage tail tape measure protein